MRGHVIIRQSERAFTWRAKFSVENSVGASRVGIALSLNGSVFSVRTLGLIFLEMDSDSAI